MYTLCAQFFSPIRLGVCEKCGVKCICCITNMRRTNILHPFLDVAFITAAASGDVNVNVDDDDVDVHLYDIVVPKHVYITFKLKPNK